MFGFSSFASTAFSTSGQDAHVVEASASATCLATLSTATHILRLCSATSSASTSTSIDADRVRLNQVGLNGTSSTSASFERIRQRESQINALCSPYISYARVRWINSGTSTAIASISAAGGYVKYGAIQLISAASTGSCIAREKWEPLEESTSLWTKVPEATDIWTKIPY